MSSLRQTSAASIEFTPCQTVQHKNTPPLRFCVGGVPGRISGSSLSPLTRCGEVLALARRFDVPGLRVLCEDVLIRSLTVENACRILQLADPDKVGLHVGPAPTAMTELPHGRAH